MKTVIVGAGHAGVQAADSLRARGFDGSVTVVSAEAGLPYQRPPLSKDFMTPGADPQVTPLRGERFFQDQEIDLLTGTRVTGIDRRGQTVHTTGGAVDYDHLVLATGARNRAVTCPGAELPGVHGLKTLDDAAALHAAMERARRVVVVGAGFIGLEFAAAARKYSAEVTVLEFAPRVMGRAVTPVMSEWFTAAHGRLGVEVRLNEGLDHLEAGADGRVAAAVSSAGHRYPADLVVVGVGVLPNDDLARDAGLAVDNGIVVDERLRTSDERIFALGDCASFPNAWTRSRLRLESVQNATDQGRHLAEVIMGSDEPYTALPWFWSVQGPYRLQMAGIALPDDDTVVLGDPSTGKFSVLSFRDEMLTAVQSVNRPADHIAARQLLAGGTRLHRLHALDQDFTLRAAAQNQPVASPA